MPTTRASARLRQTRLSFPPGPSKPGPTGLMTPEQSSQPLQQSSPQVKSSSPTPLARNGRHRASHPPSTPASLKRGSLIVDSPFHSVGGKFSTRSQSPDSTSSFDSTSHREIGVDPQSSSSSSSSSDAISSLRARPRSSLKRRRQLNLAAASSEDESSVPSSSSDVLDRTRLVKKRKRKSTTKGVPSDKSDISENAEVQDDAEDLRENEVRESRTRRNTNILSASQNARKAQLEIMKARRSRKRDQLLDGSAGENAELPEVQEDFPRQSPVSMGDEDEAGFVVEDEEDDEDSNDGNNNNGVELDSSARAAVPLEFTSFAHMRPREYFEMVVELLVHKRLSPGSERDSAMNALAWRKVGDAAQVYAGSKFSSSAWKEEFNTALMARPLLSEVAERASTLMHGCEACGRRSHPATFRVTFHGAAYNPNTLEPLNCVKDGNKDDGNDNDGDDNDGSGDEEDEDDRRSYDINGQPIPDQSREFRIGKTCRMNARVSHSLTHFKWHLNDWILGWLEAEGYLTVEKVAEQEGWNEKKRRRHANGVVNCMRTGGEMESLWRDFRNMMGSAQDTGGSGYPGSMLEG